MRDDDVTGPPAPTPVARRDPGAEAARVSLVDVLDRLLGTGVVVAGDVVISLAGVDLVQVRLHALLTSVRADLARPTVAATPVAEAVR